MHADPEAYLTSPAQRAALVASEFVGGNQSRAPYAPTGPEDNLLRQTENAQPLFFLGCIYVARTPSSVPCQCLASRSQGGLST